MFVLRFFAPISARWRGATLLAAASSLAAETTTTAARPARLARPGAVGLSQPGSPRRRREARSPQSSRSHRPVSKHRRSRRRSGSASQPLRRRERSAPPRTAARSPFAARGEARPSRRRGPKSLPSFGLPFDSIYTTGTALAVVLGLFLLVRRPGAPRSARSRTRCCPRKSSACSVACRSRPGSLPSSSASATSWCSFR